MKKTPTSRSHEAAPRPKAIETSSETEGTAAPWARALRARRKALGLTQRELSEYAGCGPAFLYELEQGKQTLRLDKLLDVLEVLGLRLRMEPGGRGLVVDGALEKPQGVHRDGVPSP